MKPHSNLSEVTYNIKSYKILVSGTELSANAKMGHMSMALNDIHRVLAAAEAVGLDKYKKRIG